MLTRSAAKRQKAESKSSPAKRLSIAQSLPTSLVVHIMRFLNDAQSLAASHSVCRNWSTFTSFQLDLCWRPLYLRVWEAESATDECIMTRGESTPWKERFHQRLIVENNWKTGNGRVATEVPLACGQVACSASRIVARADANSIAVFDMSGSELLRVSPLDNVKCVRIEGHLLATGHADGVIKLSDIESGSLVQTMRLADDPQRPKELLRVNNVQFRDSHLAASSPFWLRVWNLESGKVMFEAEGRDLNFVVNWPLNQLITVSGELISGLEQMLALSYNFTFRVYDLRSGALLSALSQQHPNRVGSGDRDGPFLISSPLDGRILTSWRLNDSGANQVYELRVSNDGRQLSLTDLDDSFNISGAAFRRDLLLHVKSPLSDSGVYLHGHQEPIKRTDRTSRFATTWRHLVCVKGRSFDTWRRPAELTIIDFAPRSSAPQQSRPCGLIKPDARRKF